MKVHDLKIWPDHYRDIRLGLKPYEIRLDDRNYQTGDYVFLREWDFGVYSGAAGMYRIKHILSDFQGLAPGYVALALNEVIDRSIP